MWLIKTTLDSLYGVTIYTFIANGKTALLSAKLADLGVLEVFPISALISVEMDAFLITDDEKQRNRYTPGTLT